MLLCGGYGIPGGCEGVARESQVVASMLLGGCCGILGGCYGVGGWGSPLLIIFNVS